MRNLDFCLDSRVGVKIDQLEWLYTKAWPEVDCEMSRVWIHYLKGNLSNVCLSCLDISFWDIELFHDVWVSYSEISSDAFDDLHWLVGQLLSDIVLEGELQNRPRRDILFFLIV